MERKNTFRRIAAIVLIFALALSVTACFGKSAVPTKEEALEQCLNSDPNSKKLIVTTMEGPFDADPLGIRD